MAKRKLLLLATTMVVKERGRINTISISTEADESNPHCTNRKMLIVHAESLRNKIKNGETDEDS